MMQPEINIFPPGMCVYEMAVVAGLFDFYTERFPMPDIVVFRHSTDYADDVTIYSGITAVPN